MPVLQRGLRMAAPNGKKAPAHPVVNQIATVLGEAKRAALGQITRIVQTIRQRTEQPNGA